MKKVLKKIIKRKKANCLVLFFEISQCEKICLLKKKKKKRKEEDRSYSKLSTQLFLAFVSNQQYVCSSSSSLRSLVNPIIRPTNTRSTTSTISAISRAFLKEAPSLTLLESASTSTVRPMVSRVSPSLATVRVTGTIPAASVTATYP